LVGGSSPKYCGRFLPLKTCLILSCAAAGLAPAAETGAPPTPDTKRGKAQKAKAGATEAPAPARQTAVGPVVGENKATPVSRLKVPDGFKVELIYSVPGATQGSWVNLCTDPKGRIYASDQYGGLYRFTPPAPGQTLNESAVEKVPAEIRAVNGMLWAFGALYVGVNDYEAKIPSGLYRLSDSDGDDKLDKVELLRAITARGDHGVHAVLLTPDGKGLYLVCGNGAKLTEIAPSSPVSQLWGDDQIGRAHV